MPSMISTNVASLNSQRSLTTSQNALATSLQRLSSGLRINSAKDDAAGMAISSRMSSQISGLNQASRNANDGISLSQTAEGGLQSISDSLQRMRELAVQSSNATNTSTDRAAIQTEVDQLVQQINTVGNQTAFNGVKLLDGSFNSQSFQIGANTGEKITIGSISSAKADALGVGTTSAYGTNVTSTAVTNGAIATGGITVNGYGVGPSVSDGVSSSVSITGPQAATVGGVYGATAVAPAAPTTFAADTVSGKLKINNVDVGLIAHGTDAITQGAAVATAINLISDTTNVFASADGTGKVTLYSGVGTDISVIAADATTASNTGFATTAQTATSSGSDYIKINDVTIRGIAPGAGDATAQGTAVAAAINASTSKTGVLASSTAGVLSLTSKNGADIKIEVGSTNAATYSGLGTATTKLGSSNAITTKVGSDSAMSKAAAFNSVTGQTGVSAVATKTLLASSGISAAAAVAGDATDYIKVNGVKLGAIAAGADANAQGNNVAAALNAVSNQTGVTASFDSTSKKISLSAADGRTITMETAGTAAVTNTGFAANTVSNTYGGLKLTSNTSAGINVGGADIAKAGVTGGYTAATATFGAGIASVDLTTASGAANAISTIDAALANINSSRANLGAVQNRFSSVVSNLATTSENLSASRSRIMDTDFASETASLSRNQILQQAGTAMLAQANSLPQGVLALLRG